MWLKIRERSNDESEEFNDDIRDHAYDEYIS